MTCGQRFKFERNSDGHVWFHVGFKPYKGGVCEKGSCWNWNMSDQLVRVHAMLMVKAEEDCPYCEQVFKRQEDLKQYVGIDILGLFCDHCGIRVKGESKNEWQMKSVHGLERFVCDCCGIMVEGVSRNEWHMKRFHGPPRVICDCCGKLLNGIDRMRRHKRIHEEATCALPYTKPSLLLQVSPSSSRPTLF